MQCIDFREVIVKNTEFSVGELSRLLMQRIYRRRCVHIGGTDGGSERRRGAALPPSLAQLPRPLPAIHCDNFCKIRASFVPC